MAEVITAREIKVFEFDRLRELLAAKTTSPMARARAVTLEPGNDLAAVLEQRDESVEGRLFCMKGGSSPATVEDIGVYLGRAAKGSALSGSELAAVLVFIGAVHSWEKYFSDREQAELYPSMAALAAAFVPCPELYALLKRSIDRGGAVLDTASPELAALRRSIPALQGRIKEKMNEYLRSAQYRRYLQEPLVTIRNDRYVLPVKQEYRNSLEGVVHDQSSSGATLFIEPLPVVKLQNELTALYRKEEKEIERILRVLSAMIASDAAVLVTNRSLYAELDFIVARGRLALEMGSRSYELHECGSAPLVLDCAIHPFITGEKVPLSVTLGGEVQTLVITGPNTGGKTVALKTIGLLAIMAQCGLLIPAGAETRLPVFRSIRADIGDEQSIDQSLSTFSGHMHNIIGIIEEADTGSLVLLDELGAGTDPSEGSALAMAILEELTSRGASSVVTTHSNELKLFAQLRYGMQNAAMEFDPDTFSPTYRLLQGIPGQSNALYIAGRLGLDPAILEKAKTFLHRSHDQVEEVIASLVEDRQSMARDSRLAAQERSRAELLLEELEKERELLRIRREDILREAREEARILVKRAKAGADALIRELKDLRDRSGGPVQPATDDIRHRFNQLRQEVTAGEENEEELPSQSLEEADLVQGGSVYVPGLRQDGELIEVFGEEARVRVGSLRVTLPLSALRKGSGQKRTGKEELRSSSGGYSFRSDERVQSEIDLRGLTLEEALPRVEKLLDSAIWGGLRKVDLIHGKGTGKLKRGLRMHLEENPLVKSCRGGSAAEGGEGVTVVELHS